MQTTVILNKEVSPLFDQVGNLLEVAGNQPFLLDDNTKTWLVQVGRVEIFSVEMRGGEFSGQRHHITTLEEGQAIFGFDSLVAGEILALLAVPVGNVQLLELPLAFWQELAHKEPRQVANYLDQWFSGLSRALMQDVVRPKVEVVLDAIAADSPPVTIAAGQHASAKRGGLWLEIVKGRAFFNGEEELEASADRFILPLYAGTWLQAANEADLIVQVFDTKTAVITCPNLWENLASFYEIFFRLHFTNIGLANFDEVNRLKQRVRYDRTVSKSVLGYLSSVLDETDTSDTALDGSLIKKDALLLACQLVGQSMGIRVIVPVESEKGEAEGIARLNDIAYASRFHTRQVILQGEWWRQDNGSLLGFMMEDGSPVALIPHKGNSYVAINPLKNTRTVVKGREQVAKFSAVAFCFYRSFPERSLHSWDVVKFGLRGCRKDLLIALALGVGGGMLAMLVPLITQSLFDTIIPSGDKNQLFQFFAGLIVAAFAAAMFELVRGIAILRVESRLDISVQAALWDRLLNLPVTFFRGYSSGDLADRAMGINYIRSLISGSVITTIVSSIFSIFSFALLFAYDLELALIAATLTLIMLAITFTASYLQLRYQRKVTDLEGKLSGLVLQLITGIAKLRVAGSEIRAFALWGKQFTQKKKVAFKEQTINNNLLVFKAVWPIITTMVIFWVVSSAHNPNITTGVFLAFNAAFAQFLFAILGLVVAFNAILQAITVFERAAPILETVPEVDTTKATPDVLKGEIEVSQVSFRYNPDGALILNNVSMKIEPGQFIAIVGPSGSGKSSLLRLLLGFDTAEAGSIYYDGQDVSGLNMQAVRRQIGVVIQNSQLMPASIFENIVGNTPLTLDDAWEAARKAGFDEDIKQMPMGMFTVISEGGGGLSGGQRQRLLIAKAIVSKPRILFFDEATSALDNRTQAIVSQSLESLQATRIVIAHRLSTVINADRIFVLQEGKFIQSGTYTELMSQKGPFQELAARQLI